MKRGRRLPATSFRARGCIDFRNDGGSFAPSDDEHQPQGQNMEEYYPFLIDTGSTTAKIDHRFSDADEHRRPVHAHNPVELADWGPLRLAARRSEQRLRHRPRRRPHTQLLAAPPRTCSHRRCSTTFCW